MGIALFICPSSQFTSTIQSTTQINSLSLIRKPSIHAKRWVHISRDALLLVNRLEFLHILGIELNQLAVLIDARGRNGFSEDGRASGDCRISVSEVFSGKI